MVIHRFCALYQYCHCFHLSRMESLSAMFKTGLYINDLSMHDSSRDLVLAGTQQSEELKRALIQVHLRRVISSHVTPHYAKLLRGAFFQSRGPPTTYCPQTRDERKQIATHCVILSHSPVANAGAKEVQ